MGRIIALIYGFASYAIFFVTFLYAIGFTTGLFVPKTVDSGAVGSRAEALAIDLALMAVFAIQHSVMARPQFKNWWTRFVPVPVERSTYVLASSLALILLFWQWRPIPGTVWQAGDPGLAMAATGLSLAGWLIVLTSTFLHDHFEFFGVKQVIKNLAGASMTPARFRTPLYYRLVRHPIYLGFIIAFWSTPTMTFGHLAFAATTTVYMVLAIQLEEHDLIEVFGDDYRDYKERVSMLVPWHKSPVARTTNAHS